MEKAVAMRPFSTGTTSITFMTGTATPGMATTTTTIRTSPNTRWPSTPTARVAAMRPFSTGTTSITFMTGTATPSMATTTTSTENSPGIEAQTS